MKYNNDPRLSHDFRREFAKVQSPCSETRAAALGIFKWLDKHKAQDRFNSALNQCLKHKSRFGPRDKPIQFGAASPSPQDCTATIMGLDARGQLRCIASNALPKPTVCKATDAMPPELIDKLCARGVSVGDQLDLIHKAISIAAKDKMDMVDRVCAEGKRHRISPIFLLVIDEKDAHLYCTTALVDVVAEQTDLSMQWTGQVYK